MTARDLGAVILFVGFVVVAATSGATGYLFGIYRRSAPPRSVLFRAIIETSVVSVIVGTYFLAITLATRVFGLTFPDVILVPNTAAVVALLSPPVRYAWAVHRLRRLEATEPED